MQNNANFPVDTARLTTDPTELLKQPYSSVFGATSPFNFLSYALHINDASDQSGEDWATVLATGDGFYAHVESIPGNRGLINIEYTILWAYNNASCNHHNGDITTMVVVYDSDADLLTRLTYSIHGGDIESFRIAQPVAYAYLPLTGRDDAGSFNSAQAVQLQISNGDQYQMGDSHHSPGVNAVYLVQDPISHLYEHPVAFVEHGSHEMWPNSTGKVFDAPAHSGDGFNFLAPQPLSILEINSDPTISNGDAPFLFFNGLWGTDPHPPLLHKTWFWPEGRGSARDGPKNRLGLTADFFSDKDPYVNMTASMPWPPNQEYEFQGVNAYVQPGASVIPQSFPPHSFAALNDKTHPFPDPFAAVSAVPCGSTIFIQSGKYAGNGILSRRCRHSFAGPITLRASGGAVVLGP